MWLTRDEKREFDCGAPVPLASQNISQFCRGKNPTSLFSLSEFLILSSPACAIPAPYTQCLGLCQQETSPSNTFHLDGFPAREKKEPKISTYRRKTLSVEQVFLSVKSTAEELSTMPLDAMTEQKEQTGVWSRSKILVVPGSESILNFEGKVVKNAILILSEFHREFKWSILDWCKWLKYQMIFRMQLLNFSTSEISK